MKETLNITYSKNIFSKLAVLLVVLLLHGCGGSSSDDTVYSISATTKKVSFSNEFLNESTESTDIKITFDGDGLLVGFASASEDPRWLFFQMENITKTSATLNLQLFEAEQLVAGTYNTVIRLTTSNKDGSKFSYHDIDVSLIVWNIATNPEQVNFSATFGDAKVVTQQIEIASNNEWTATTDVSWLSLDVESGNGNGSINVSADPTYFSGFGLAHANIIFTELSSGQSKKIPVQLALDKIYLYADSPAIALTKTTNITAVEKTITISNNSETVIAWQASTTADWLTLTPIGDSQLQISANTSLAPTNKTSRATITISTKDEMLIMDESIKVAFYHSDIPVENKLIEPLAITSEILTSPSLPKVYLAKGNKLHTYNQYTATLEKELVVSPEGTELAQLIMHPNGEYLLAKAVETITNDEDSTTSELVHRYRINLIDNTFEKIAAGTINTEPLAIVRLSGRYFVLTNALEFADENLQLLSWDGANAYFTNRIDMATKTNSLFVLDNNKAMFKRYTAQINDFGENKILPQLTHSYRPESLSETQFINSFMVTNDEKNIYAISETSEWISFDGTTFTDNGLLEKDDNVVNLFLVKSQDESNSSIANYLKIDPTQLDNGFYLATYDDQQNVSRTTFTEGNPPSSITISSDNQRLIINTNTARTPEEEARIEFVTLEP